MAIQLFSTKPRQVHAMQLLTQNNPHSDNAQEIADWCGGRAVWNYNSESGKREVFVTFISQIDVLRVDEAGWVIRTVDGSFDIMSDDEFQEEFDTEPFNAPPTCQHCLSDPRYTPMGDPDEKRCPVCGVRYSGPRRSKEFVVLLTSGLVAEEN